MRSRRRQLVGLAAAALLVLAAPASAGAAVAVSPAVTNIASPFQKPFLAPQPRPTEARSRPTDDPDPNRNAYTVPAAPRSPACSRHFCVHWVGVGLDAPSLADLDADGLPDYVQRVLQVAEHVYEVENERLGWRQPKGDGRKGGGVDKTDIYLAQIGGQLFGYAAPDRGQATKERRIPRRLHGYLVLDNDYSPFEFPGTKQLEDLQVTLAHEYNHILQFGYDAYQDPWFAEASAVWMEDQVYDGIDDYLRYVHRWVRRYHTPLTTNSIKQYGSAVWIDWLTRRFGKRIVRGAWARAIHTRPGGFSVNALGSAIRAAGRSSLSREFARFAAAVVEWRTGRGFSESRLYPDQPRQGRLRLGAKPLRRLLDHTTFQALRVRARGGRAVAVRVTAPRGTATGLAIVGRLGSERRGRTVTSFRYSSSGGRLVARLSRPGRFSRITAVVVNADARARGFGPRRLDWRYLTDTLPFEIYGRLIR